MRIPRNRTDVCARWAENGFDMRALEAANAVNALPFRLRGLLKVTPGVAENGPLTPWSPEARALLYYLHGPGDAYSLIVEACFQSNQTQNVSLRRSRRGGESLSICELKFPLFVPGFAHVSDLGTFGEVELPALDLLQQLGHEGVP